MDLANHIARRGARSGSAATAPPAKRNNPNTLRSFAVREVSHDYKSEFEQQLSLVGIQTEREFVFARPRKWRADWRVKDTQVLVEFEGGLFAKDKIGHGNVGGILRDIAKYNEAALLGYTVIRITPKHVTSGQALKWVEQAVKTSQAINALVGEGDQTT